MQLADFVALKLFTRNTYDLVTHLPLNKMDTVSQTDFSDAFSWMINFVFWLKFHWNFFPLRVQLTKPSIGLDNGLAPNRRQAIIWTNADPVHWRIYAALGGDEYQVRFCILCINMIKESPLVSTMAWHRRCKPLPKSVMIKLIDAAILWCFAHSGTKYWHSLHMSFQTCLYHRRWAIAIMLWSTSESNLG